LIAAREGVDAIMLDNFQVEYVRKAVDLLESEGLRSVIVKASGGITPENVAEYAETGPPAT